MGKYFGKSRFWGLNFVGQNIRGVKSFRDKIVLKFLKFLSKKLECPNFSEGHIISDFLFLFEYFIFGSYLISLPVRLKA